MKRLFYLLFGLVLLPALLYAQGSLSPKDINDNLTNNYYNKTASDARYATTTYGYSSAEVDILLAPKADKTYVNATDEAILLDDDSQDVQIESNRVAIITKAATTYVNATDEAIITDLDSAEAVIQNILADDDSQDVTIEANRVGVASLEVGLQTHMNNPTGAHAATAISATWTNVQVSLDSIEAAIQGIVVGSGFATEAWVNSTLETNFYNKTQTDDTIAAAIAAIPTPSVNQTVTVTAGEALTAGQVVSLINKSGTMKAYNNPLTVSTSPNGAGSVFNSAATTYCSAVALDSTRFLVAYIDASADPRAIVGTVAGSSISWGTVSDAFEGTTGSNIAVCLISTDKVMATYSNDGSGNTRVRLLHITGTAIAVGEVTTSEFSASAYNSITKLDTDVALICYKRTSDNYGRSYVATVSGTTPSVGNAATFNAAATAFISVSALSSTSAIVAYQDGGNSNYGTAQVLSISGTTITPGTEYVFKETVTSYISCCALNSTTGIISTNTGAGNGYAYHFTNSSGTLAYGSECGFDADAGGTVYQSIAPINATHAILVYKDGTDTVDKNIIFTVSGTTLSASAKYTINAAQSRYNSVCYLGSNKSVVCYEDYGNSSYGTSVINTWATANYASVSGISSGAYSSGSDAVVLISGVSDDQSGLITGSPYFLQSDFTIGTTPVSLAKYYNSSTATGEIKIGTAKSATELVITIDYK